ncbi:hypothetical protein LAUMK136_03175 [Mycobacterium attenuatum]|uniref:DUF2314 domain-containing protein n=1 Tax=Mycobacterium attenuatum TaxID=2341086 RepID=A0A498Q542_9MYCO|nr:DUF2314 domain-containing protein [Mycobacterium attenuatum]VBA39803.1 hypothetical protein LAUMK136_03175 [Mycobacterium attenuatum]
MNSDPFQHFLISTDLIPAGPLVDDPIVYTFAIYYLPMPSTDPIGTLDVLLANKFEVLHVADFISGDEKIPTLRPWLTVDPRNDCPPPSPDFIQLVNHGMSSQQAAALQNTKAALVLDFIYTAEHTWHGLRAALQLTGQLAAATSGVIWDDESREFFTPAAWNETRIDRWNDVVPEIDDHTTIRAYETGGQMMRAVTLGMRKFGLPDVVVNGFPRSAGGLIGNLVSAFCQAIADGLTIQRHGEFDLDIRRIRPDATGTAPLTVKMGTHQAGDPNNRLLEITFDRGTGDDVHTRRHAVLTAVFGSGSTVVSTTHGDALNAASQQARTKLPVLRALFNDGLAPGEWLQLKAPFDAADGVREWMWVEVTSWTDDAITGFLVNGPASNLGLHAGQTVEIAESTVFDYMHKRSDGVVEGNETERLIRSRLN